MDIECDTSSSLLQIIDLNGVLAGSRGSRHSADSGATSDSTETKDNVFDETASPFRSSLEMSPPVSPSTPTPPFIQKEHLHIKGWYSCIYISLIAILHLTLIKRPWIFPEFRK